MSKYMILIDINHAKELSDYCEHQLMDLINDKKIPHMTIIKEQDNFMVFIDSCCSCQCPHRYKTFTIPKERFYHYLTEVLKSNSVVKDTIFDLH